MPIVKLEDVARKTFNYIVIGGGTAGLTVAARLSEEPSNSVLFLKTLGNPQYDWAFPVLDQKHANNSKHIWSRGKGLGGSSAMNFYAWIKPPAADMDAIEQLGNPGWNWSEFEKYSKRSETFLPASKEQIEVYHYPDNSITEHRGTSGPIQVAIPHGAHTLDKLFQETMINKGFKDVKDPYSGDINGTWIASSSIDPKTWTRSFAATAYLVPNLDRENLSILTGAYVSKILFDGVKSNEKLKSSGVQFIYQGETHVVHTDREVILSAGAIKSPHVLELSGIGNPKILEKVGINVNIDLPGVGENVQEHYGCSVTYELNPDVSHETIDRFREPGYAEKAKELHTLGQGIHRTGLTSFAYFPLVDINADEAATVIKGAEEEVKDLVNGGTLRPGVEEQLKLQLSILRDNNVPDLTPEPNTRYATVTAILNHPISRGTIHTESVDPLAYPIIDPHYLESNTDLEVLVQHIKFIKSLANTEPWKSGIIREVYPGPNYSSDRDIREYVKEHVLTIWHTIGGCSMLPRSKSGVVDANLKVYGTTNLRVVDLSVIPLHIAAHTQATAYFLGEKAASIIKGE
ncbi:GMC oxidoreductase family protein Mala s 12 [Psilocybe cubensis]|uniref:GMC oxidoreductase family protein Mala s 12 n=1 Tax=Psilocybe cubensis TaxID=181762 RepID=A0ACB8GP22_PSICU|nr:GMC oxidoreductase family protein Mala s 12 [Psilocybe cubensis]KAH9476794.1 GMC oxidoreductase family protein Mala s 12 [Psilocybe cubensis]